MPLPQKTRYGPDQAANHAPEKRKTHDSGGESADGFETLVHANAGGIFERV
jgi:hypothetical protein